MITAKIPYEFISQRVELGWNDIKFGLDHQWITPKVAIEKATEGVCRSESASKDELELASRAESDPVADLVSCLAKAETGPADEDLKGKWLYLVLAWLFEARQSLVDPLGMVEQVYSEFEYPREVTPFVRYMPMEGPDLRNREQNEARMFDKWKTYLDDAGRRFARPARNS